MKIKFLFFLLVLPVQFCFSQNNDSNFSQNENSRLQNNNNTMKSTLPYSEIPSYNGQYNSGNILSRMIDGLAYRYFWATDGLTTKDLAYKPSDDARDTKHTLEHIYGLSETILNVTKNQPNIRPADWTGVNFVELRKLTLMNLKNASEFFKNKTAEDIAQLNIIFEFKGKKSVFPFWNMINGPISDALYHTGQVVSFRRSSGNPINPNVNVFLGKNNK